MTLARVSAIILVLALTSGLAACGKDEIRTSCDEPRPYQLVTKGDKVVVPEGLDPLDEYKEMRIPEAQAAAQQPAAGKCLESPPAIR